MIARPVRRAPLTEHEADLWEAFVEHYSATKTRPTVDVFLRGLIGAPRG